MEEILVPVKLIYPGLDQFKLEMSQFKPSVLYRSRDSHAASDEEEKNYIDEVNSFLSTLLGNKSFIDFFNSNNRMVTREQLSAFLNAANLQLKEPNTSKYYCYSDSGYYGLSSRWLYDKRIAPSYQFVYDGILYELSDKQKAFPAFYMNGIKKQKQNQDNDVEWYYFDEFWGFGSLFCLASKYLIPSFYRFYKDTDGVDSDYLCEYGVSFDDCPGLTNAISFVREKLTKVSFQAAEENPFCNFDWTLLYTDYDEVRSLIKENRTTLKKMAGT